MNPPVALPATHALRVLLARAYQRLGVAGALGGLLLLAAVVIGAHAWRIRESGPRTLADRPQPNATQAPPAPAAPQRVLPDPSDMPRLLSRIERAATTAGLGWPRADYRFNAASEEYPASVEARCALKGSYPALRRFVTALLQDAPTLTLREFSLSRSSTDAAELEAKLVIAIYVGSGPAAARP